MTSKNRLTIKQEKTDCIIYKTCKTLVSLINRNNPVCIIQSGLITYSIFVRFTILCPHGADLSPILAELNAWGHEATIECCRLDELASSLFFRLSNSEKIIVLSEERPKEVLEKCSSAVESFTLGEEYQKTEIFDGGMLSGAMFEMTNAAMYVLCGDSSLWLRMIQRNVLFDTLPISGVAVEPQRYYNSVGAEKSLDNSNKTKPKSGKLRPILKVMAVFLVFTVFATSGAYLAIFQGEKREHNKLKNEIAGLYKVSERTEDTPAAEPASVENEGEEPESGGTVLGASDSFIELGSLNSETIGWINIPNTQVDYPIVQTNNNEYYLKHDFKKRFSSYGSIFADANSNLNIDNPSQNVTLFGHNTDDGTMFGELKKYLNLSFYKENPVFTFDSVYKQGKWVVFSVFVATSDIRSNQFFEWRHTNFADEKQNKKFIDEVKQRSVHNTGIEVLPGEQTVMLTSCSKDFYGARLIVAARRVRAGEAVDTQNAAENPAPLFPTQWYS